MLALNPASLFATTPEDESPLELARSKATKKHPNTILIKELEVLSKLWVGDKVYNELELMEEAAIPPPSLSNAPPPAQADPVESAPGLIAETVPHRCPDSAAEALLLLANTAPPQVGVFRVPQRDVSYASPLQVSQSDPGSIAEVIHDGAPDSQAQAVANLDESSLLAGVFSVPYGEAEQYAEV
jgi:hypothetical protein